MTTDGAEYGGNELDLLEFSMGNQYYGINVAKVRRLLRYEGVSPLQNSHPSVEGVIRPEDTVITVLDLAAHLGFPPSETPEREVVIITDFSNLNFAFHVHGVEGIHQVSWSQVQKPDQFVSDGNKGAATGIVHLNGRIVTILDFERIVAEISPGSSILPASAEAAGSRAPVDKTILIAEDSSLLSRLIAEALGQAGYVNSIQAEDGQDAWGYLEQARDSGHPPKDLIACVVSDVEMPRMDGRNLTRLIKADPALRDIPVILFTSLMEGAGEKDCGADARVTKPDVAALVAEMDRLIQ